MKSPSKICITSPFPPPFGGMAVQAEKLVRLLQKEGIEVIKVETNVELTGILRIFSPIPILRTIIRQIVFLIQLNKAVSGVESVYFLTGFFNFFFWVTYPALILLLFKKKKIILSARGGGARLFFQKYRFLVKPILKKVHTITVPSGFLQVVFKEELEIKTQIIPNIADLEQFTFRKRDKFQPKLIVTRLLEEIYDISTVIRAFHLVHEQYPEARLGIAGKGSLKEQLEQEVEDLGIAGNVEFHGEVSHEDIFNVYDQYDIFINASTVDNLPGSLLEAFAAGLPVVSTNAGGIPYIVVHKENGLLSEIKDYKSLSGHVLEILKNSEFGEALAMKGYVELQKYTWPSIKKKLVPLLTNE